MVAVLTYLSDMCRPKQSYANNNNSLLAQDLSWMQPDCGALSHAVVLCVAVLPSLEQNSLCSLGAKRMVKNGHMVFLPLPSILVYSSHFRVCLLTHVAISVQLAS